MERIVKLVKDIEVPLSDYDLLKQMRHKANLVTYPEIKNYRSIDELLGPNNVVFILYLWEPNYGHWCCVTKHDFLIEFFDPYGNFVDDCLDEMSTAWKLESGQDKPYLSILMRNCPYELSYNEFQFQKYDNDSASCGRWSIIRGLLKELTLEQFVHLFLNQYGDDIATILTT